jgi:hypothetical protein
MRRRMRDEDETPDDFPPHTPVRRAAPVRERITVTSSVSGRRSVPWKKRIARFALLVLAPAALLAVAAWYYCVRMPGVSFVGEAPRPSQELTELAARLEQDVRHLAEHLPGRTLADPEAYAAAAAWVERRFREAGYTDVVRHTFVARNVSCHNIEVTVPGIDLASEIVVVGAHYDTVPGTPGADDNASGVAAVLELAARLRTSLPRRTVRFVAFANEEPPHFQTADMGSLVYARACRERGDDVVAMLSFDGIGHYGDVDGSQRYPGVLGLAYPSRADFIAFVGNPASRRLVHRAIEAFRKRATIPSEGAVLPSDLTGVGWSDHWSFWQVDYPALEITDTLPFRYAHYHQVTDTPDRLDYVRMARVVEGVQYVLRDLTERGGAR